MKNVEWAVSYYSVFSGRTELEDGCTSEEDAREFANDLLASPHMYRAVRLMSRSVTRSKWKDVA